MRAGVPWRTNCGQRKLGPVNRPRRFRRQRKSRGNARPRRCTQTGWRMCNFAAQISRVFRRTARPEHVEHCKHFAPAGLDYAINRFPYGARLHSGILGRRPATLDDAFTFVDRVAWVGRARYGLVVGDENASMKASNRKRFTDETGTRAAASRADGLRRCLAPKAEMATEARWNGLAQNLISAG